MKTGLQVRQEADQRNIDAARVVIDGWTKYQAGSVTRLWAARVIQRLGTEQDKARLAQLEKQR